MMSLEIRLLRPARRFAAFAAAIGLCAAATLAAATLASAATPVVAHTGAGPSFASGSGSTSAGGETHAAVTHRRRARRAAAAAVRFRESHGADELLSDLSDILTSRVRGGHWGVMVVSLTRGDTLFAREPGRELHPASTMKLFTTAFALDRFGPDHQFSTDVLRGGPIGAGGVLEGDLVLRGDGDPGLSNRFYRGEPGEPMELLARFVKGAGITRIAGDLIADASAFDDNRIPDGWLRRYLGASYAAPVSALSLNENVVTVVVRPGAGGQAAAVTLEPPSSALPVLNAVKTIPGRSGMRVSVRRVRGAVQASGWIGGASDGRTYELIVDDPARFTAGAFRDALAAQGITVDGEIRVASSPPGAELVTSLPSPPLSRLIAVMNRESINHYAELLFRDASRGPDREGAGSVDAGSEQLKAFLATKVGSPPDDVVVADGSGLSTIDRINARSLVRLLAYAHQASWSSAFHASLPVAGESELLKHRMQWTPAQGNLHAKTGTTNSVASLGGYVTAQDGEVIAFAFIYNGSDRWNAKLTMDAMGATLASFARP
jgi:serine-type D-Ala-D-Ala carboxypeptidase/endopeptidase (penicillin-binding protein 4)